MPKDFRSVLCADWSFNTSGFLEYRISFKVPWILIAILYRISVCSSLADLLGMNFCLNVIKSPLKIHISGTNGMR